MKYSLKHEKKIGEILVKYSEISVDGYIFPIFIHIY